MKTFPPQSLFCRKKEKRIPFTNKTIQTNSPLDASRVIREGGVVVFPTETVYGIGASSLNHDACERIYRIKNRPMDNPLICHFADLGSIEIYAKLTNQARNLLERFSPGPITVILKKKSNLLFTTNLETVAVRIPNHSLAQQLLRESGCPISAPSANPSGKPSFTRSRDVLKYFDGKVDCILLGEDSWHTNSHIGIESTVLDMSGDSPKLLRPGSIELDEIQEVLGTNVLIPNHPEAISPGVKYRHYSPNGKVHIFRDFPDLSTHLGELEKRISSGEKPNPIAFIGFRELEKDLTKWTLESEGRSGIKRKVYSVYIDSNHNYAKELYGFFLDCDRWQVEEVFCELPKTGRLFQALKNRLEKASEASV